MASRHDRISDLLPSFHRYLLEKNRSPRTVTNYCSSAELLESWLIHDSRSANLADIGRQDIEAFVVDQLKRRSAATAATRFRCLQQYFKWLALEDEIDSNPMAGMTAPNVEEPPVPILMEDELEALLQSTEGQGFDRRRDHAIIRVLIDTGIRVGELVQIELGNVDLNRGEILVHGKGARSRHVPLGAKSVEALNRYLGERRCQPHEGDAALWIGVRGPLSESGVAQLLRRRGAECGVDGVTPNRFRHSFAHKWLLDGGDEGDLQQLAGWRSNQMMQRYRASARAERASRLRTRAVRLRGEAVKARTS